MGANDPHAVKTSQPAEKGFPWFSVEEEGETQTVQQSAGLPRSNFDFGMANQEYNQWNFIGSADSILMGMPPAVAKPFPWRNSGDEYIPKVQPCRELVYCCAY
jgi:hypothetical protein